MIITTQLIKNLQFLWSKYNRQYS